MIITAAEFARMAGVSRVAISKAPPHKVHKEPTGAVDTDHPINAAYLTEHGKGPAGAPAKQAKPAKKAQNKKPDPEDAAFQAEVLARIAKREKAKTKKGSAEGDDGDDEIEDDDIAKFLEIIQAEGGSTVLVLKKMKADIAYKEAATARYHLELETKKGNLMPRSLFITAVQGINKAIDDHIHRTHAKTGPVVFALARRDGASELEVTRTLEVDYGNALRRAVEDIERLAR